MRVTERRLEVLGLAAVASCSSAPLKHSDPRHTPAANHCPQNPHPYHQTSPPNYCITICIAPLSPDYANHLSGLCGP